MTTRNMKVHTPFNLAVSQVKQLDGGGAMLAPFDAEFSDEELRITLTVDVLHGRPSCTSYTVQQANGLGLELMTTEIGRGLNLRKFMSHAVARAALESVGDGQYSPAKNMAALDAVLTPARRTREPMTDERLRDFAEAYAERYRPGCGAQFSESLFMSETNMRRMLRLARERGFLPPATRKGSAK